MPSDARSVPARQGTELVRLTHPHNDKFEGRGNDGIVIRAPRGQTLPELRGHILALQVAHATASERLGFLLALLISDRIWIVGPGEACRVAPRAVSIMTPLSSVRARHSGNDTNLTALQIVVGAYDPYVSP